jgi:hypothetical protein
MMLQEACAKWTVKNTQVLEWHKRFRDGHETDGLFCTTTHLHIGRWMVKKCLAKHNATLWSIRHIRDLSPHRIFPVSATKCVLKRQRFAIADEVTAKATRTLTVVSKKVSRNAFRSFTHYGKSVSLSKGTTLKEMCK